MQSLIGTGLRLKSTEYPNPVAVETIGQEILKLPEEEKLKYRAQLEEGDYNGYRPLGMIEQFPGQRDNWECYHVFKFIPEHQRLHPAVVLNHYAEIEKFHRHVHQNVECSGLKKSRLMSVRSNESKKRRPR
ncbi:hypothetical protein MMC07_002529 [Pseudocyphellaria aurata]|nr:hypothetical protein [Pseudocyphellaria aurata]